MVSLQHLAACSQWEDLISNHDFIGGPLFGQLEVQVKISPLEMDEGFVKGRVYILHHFTFTIIYHFRWSEPKIANRPIGQRQNRSDLPWYTIVRIDVSILFLFFGCVQLSMIIYAERHSTWKLYVPMTELKPAMKAATLMCWLEPSTAGHIMSLFCRWKSRWFVVSALHFFRSAIVFWSVNFWFQFQVLCLLPYSPGWLFSNFLIPSPYYLSSKPTGCLKPRLVETTQE